MEQIIVYPLLYIPGGDGRISEPSTVGLMYGPYIYPWKIPPKKWYTSLGNNIANSLKDYFEVESLIFVMQNFQYFDSVCVFWSSKLIVSALSRLQ